MSKKKKGKLSKAWKRFITILILTSLGVATVFLYQGSFYFAQFVPSMAQKHLTKICKNDDKCLKEKGYYYTKCLKEPLFEIRNCLKIGDHYCSGIGFENCKYTFDALPIAGFRCGLIKEKDFLRFELVQNNKECLNQIIEQRVQFQQNLSQKKREIQKKFVEIMNSECLEYDLCKRDEIAKAHCIASTSYDIQINKATTVEEVDELFKENIEQEKKKLIFCLDNKILAKKIQNVQKTFVDDSKRMAQDFFNNTRLKSLIRAEEFCRGDKVCFEKKKEDLLNCLNKNEFYIKINHINSVLQFLDIKDTDLQLEEKKVMECAFN